jgi:hypothetical protein
MALMFGNLYRALTVAGAPDEQAQKAAEEVASYEKAINEVRSDTAVLKWMVGFTLGAQHRDRVKILIPG